MWSHLVLSSLLVVGASFAPAPIQLGGLTTKRLILMPTSRSPPAISAEWPQDLTIRDPNTEKSAGEIPHFVSKLDDTIVWESMGLCIEASGTQRGNVVRLSHCNGGPTQRWDWFPGGILQLKGTNQCLDTLVDKQGDMDGAPVVLQECQRAASSSWKFEAPEKQQVGTSEPQHADMYFNLAILYWSGLITAFFISILDKLWNKGARAQSQSLVSDGHVAAVMAVQPDPVTCVTSGGGCARRSTVPTMVARETTTRSAVKAILWRLFASSVTACTSMVFTGSAATAAAIVGWGLCSKSVMVFVGERLWNRFDWGREKGEDSSKRSFAKALAWRVFAAANTLVASIVLTKGNAGAASKIASTDALFKLPLFYFYERVWAKISWGKVLEEETDEIGLENMGTASG